MQSWHSLQEFSDLESVFRSALPLYDGSRKVSLVAHSDLQGVLAMAQLEAAFIDSGLSFSRRFVSSRKQMVEVAAPFIKVTSFGDDDPGTRLEDGGLVISPKEMEFDIGTSGNRRNGVIEQVAQCAVLAEMLSSGSPLIKRLRPWALAGAWLRDSMDTAFDAQYSRIKDLLCEEGSIRTVCIVEVEDCEVLGLSGISTSLLNRMRRRWDSMDLEQRSSAMSDLMLPALENEMPSTARIEELGWKRVLSKDWKMDLATMLHRAQQEWPEGGDQLHSSRLLDGLLRTGEL